jgi:hypothetical protein
MKAAPLRLAYPHIHAHSDKSRHFRGRAAARWPAPRCGSGPTSRSSGCLCAAPRPVPFSGSRASTVRKHRQLHGDSKVAFKPLPAKIVSRVSKFAHGEFRHGANWLTPHLQPPLCPFSDLAASFCRLKMGVPNTNVICPAEPIGQTFSRSASFVSSPLQFFAGGGRRWECRFFVAGAFCP